MNANNLSDEVIYPYHEWKIIEDNFDQETNYRDETIFTLGNGYLGVRGNFEERYDWPPGTSSNGTYINGFYETSPIQYGEEAYGYADYTQTMLNVTDGKIIKLYLEDEEFNLFEGKLIDYRRVLDMKKGVLTREVIWESPSGKQVKINIKRLVSFVNKHLALIKYEVIPLNFSGKITLISALDGEISNQNQEGDPRVGSHLQGQPLQLIDKVNGEKSCALIQETINTQFKLICGMKNQLKTNNRFRSEVDQPAQMIREKFFIEAKQNEKVTLTKYITYHTSQSSSKSRLLTEVKSNLNQAGKKDFSYFLKEQKEYLKEFWKKADVKIKGDEALQQGIRFNEFHLLQSVGKDGMTNIAAKGLTGEGYEGHYFWDTETYIFPFFLYNKPEISRKLLEYRYNTLDKARSRARTMAHEKGALYPWRTIAGEECSAYFPAGTAQYHINADISYAIKTYMEAAQDEEFLLEYGAEILFETARLWIDVGAYIPAKGDQFCINDVTGPDEYTAIVNNNFYTNHMARINLQYAADVAGKIKEENPEVYQQLKEKINLADEEIKEWEKAAKDMYLPYNEELGIHPQDDSFLEKEVWDFEDTPEDKYPLLLHYHPLVIYRHQVCKQADVVLALFLLGDQFSKEEKKRDFDYYEKITTHDSSLSTCIYSIIAAEIGYYDKAYDYFMETARMDLDNYHNNTQHGVHTACMAGTWMCVVNGFAGMRTFEGELKFDPYLPEKWEEYEFNITFKGREIKVKIDSNTVAYRLLAGEELKFYHQDQEIKLNSGEEKIVNY